MTLRLFAEEEAPREPFGADFDRVFADRTSEAEEFYRSRIPPGASDDDRRISRQAYAGLLWTKQFYHYVVKEWLEGDPGQPPPPASRRQGRNKDWGHLFNRDVISMPDKWEYPWYAAWDSAFHMIPMAEIDPRFAKEQLILFLREWYMSLLWRDIASGMPNRLGPVHEPANSGARVGDAAGRNFSGRWARPARLSRIGSTFRRRSALARSRAFL